MSALFVHAAYIRFSIPQWTFLTPDSGYYLNPALIGRIEEMGPRTIPYPLFCWGLLALTDDWRSIAIVQHLLGMVGPALLLAAWVFLGARLYHDRLRRQVHEWLGLVIPCLLLPSSSYVLYEHMAMLESFNAFLQCSLGALFCLLWAPTPARFRRLVATGVSFLGVAMYFTNPRWGAAAPLSVFLAGVASYIGRDRLQGWWHSLWPVLAAAVAAWLLIGLPQARIQARNPWTKAFTAKHLLWMHADLAAVEFRRDLAATPAPPNAELLQKLAAKIEKATVGVMKSGWSTIPFNAESLLYAPDNPDGDLIAAYANDPDGYSRFCLHYYGQIIRKQPLAFAERIGVELQFFYTGHGGSMFDGQAALEKYFAQSATISRALAPRTQPFRQPALLAAVAAMEPLAKTPDLFTPLPILPAIDAKISEFLWLGSLLAAIGAGAVLVRRKCRKQAPLAAAAGVCLSALAILFAQVLTLAMVTAAAPRYTEALRTLVVFSVVAGVWLGANLVCAGRTDPPSLSPDP